MSDSLEDLIRYESENTRLDFKKEEYIKEKYTSFLKDILSMANAHVKEDRFIIVGLKPKDSENRDFIGISTQLTDSATYQQLIYENIEPELNVEYVPFNLDSYLFGVFRITGCTDPPYLMKKDYGDSKSRLNKGEGFIRKGTHQARLVRKDFDKYLENKLSRNYFSGDLEFDFVNKNGTNKITLVDIDEIIRPSAIKRKEIETVLQEKYGARWRFERFGKMNYSSIEGLNFGLSQAMGGYVPYEGRSIATLEQNLLDVEETYKNEDYYELFEKNANKINIAIYNKGDSYIEDATLIVRVPNITGIYVVPKIYQNPSLNSGPVSLESLEYPLVEEESNFYIIKDPIGDVKHQMSQEAFSIDIRVFASTKIIERDFTIDCELFAKNLKKSIKKELLIKTE